MIKKIYLFGFLLLNLAIAQAFAFPPNLYTCSGAGVALRYTPGIGGVFDPAPTLLTLKLGNNVYKANAKQIETGKTVMGQVKTITLKMIPDVSIQKASVILPTINLGNTAAGQAVNKVGFKSQLALTTIATPFIANRFVGIVNKSDYVDLNCIAELLLIP